VGGSFSSLRKPPGRQGHFDSIDKGGTLGQDKYRVVITDCDHGSIEEEKDEFGRMGAELILAQVQKEEDLIQFCSDSLSREPQYLFFFHVL
jgi:hypothetical protein